MQILEQKYDQLSMHMVRPSFADSSVKSTWLKDYIQKGELNAISAISMKSEWVPIHSVGSSTNVIIPSEIATEISSNIFTTNII